MTWGSHFLGVDLSTSPWRRWHDSTSGARRRMRTGRREKLIKRSGARKLRGRPSGYGRGALKRRRLGRRRIAEAGRCGCIGAVWAGGGKVSPSSRGMN
eukprot:scaffold104647_cov28-Tisochrysis_lutea.AAC.2